MFKFADVFENTFKEEVIAVVDAIECVDIGVFGEIECYSFSIVLFNA